MATMPEDRAVTPPPANHGGKGKGLFTGTLLGGVEPRELGRNVTRGDFETHHETTAPLGLLAEVVDSLELEHDLETVTTDTLAENMAKLAMKVILTCPEMFLRCLEGFANTLL